MYKIKHKEFREECPKDFEHFDTFHCKYGALGELVLFYFFLRAQHFPQNITRNWEK
jgi:hypothetical protein